VWKSLQKSYELKSHWFCQWLITTRGFLILPLSSLVIGIFFISFQSLLPLSSCLSSFMYITKTNLLWITTSWTRLLCWWGGGPKRVHNWGWTRRKPSQQTVVGLARPSLFDENFQMVCLVYQLSLNGNWGTCLYTSNSLQKKLEIKKTRPSFPQTMRSVHMYVKLASSWNFLWLKLEWKVLWSLPLYFLSFRYFNFPLFPFVSVTCWVIW